VVVPLAVDKGKKKQSGNVRKILYAKKSLKDWLEELVSFEPRSSHVGMVRAQS
jgi:hypothetical protein